MSEKIDIDNMPTIELVYIGYRFDNGKHEHLWHRVDRLGRLAVIDTGNGSRAWWLSKHKNMAQASPGMIFSFPTPNDGKTVYSSHAKFIESHADEADVSQWQAEHQAHKLAHREAGKAAQAQKKNLALERLGPFRSAYTRLSTTERVMMLAWVIRYITQGK